MHVFQGSKRRAPRLSSAAFGCITIGLALGTACTQDTVTQSASEPASAAGAGQTASSVQPSAAGQVGRAGAGAGAVASGVAGAGSLAVAGAKAPAGAAGAAVSAGGAGGASTAGVAAVAGSVAASAGSPAAGSGGASAGMPAAGSGVAGGAAPSMPATAAGQCGNAQPSLNPFGCKFAWGTNDPGGSLSAFAGLSFMTKWVGYELDKSGNLPKCDGCTWLMQQVQGTAFVPVYYAYFIGFFGKANGLPDGNENPNGPNLTTDASKLIRAQRAGLLNAYSSYAKQSAAVWKDKPLVWLLEGDFVQYAGDTQKEKLSYAELGELARDITCAIKSQMPNAVVAINHSTWNSDQVTNDFWAAMKTASYDMIWTTGVANNQGFMEKDANASKYNAKTATYAYLRMLTGKTLFVDTSFGLSEMADSWSGADAATLNARIADGVIAANVTKPPADYVSKVGALNAQLQMVCK